MKIDVPAKALAVIEALEAAGHTAHVVGGCVRDAIMGRTPNDWDICTSARPEQTKAAAAAAGFATFDTGIQHGTITIHVDHEPFEVTTYRADGTYSDGRHPDGVEFLDDVAGDLLRRDFTINAMAYHPQRGLVDVTGGREDLQAGVLRAVGDAHTRFEEDGLRIIRALRFSAVLGFDIAPETAAAIHADRQLLDRVAMERISVEFLKLICSDHAAEILLEYKDVTAVFLPQVEPMFGFEQHNPYHDYDVWEHCVRACAAIEADPLLRLAALLHDVGKPHCFHRDEQGVGHFYRHPSTGAPIAAECCRTLKLPKVYATAIEPLVRYHDSRHSKVVHKTKQMILELGEERCRQIFKVMRADLIAHSSRSREENLQSLAEIERKFDETVASMAAFSIADLAISGGDLIAAGLEPGPEIGRILSEALTAVVEDGLPNEREALMSWALED